MSTKTIHIPIDEAVTQNQPFNVDLGTTAKGGPLPGHFKQYDRQGIVVKNFTEGRLVATINGERNTVARYTTDTMTEQTPTTVSIRPDGTQTVDPDDMELLIIVSRSESSGRSSGVVSALVEDVNPLSSTLDALRNRGATQ